MKPLPSTAFALALAAATPLAAQQSNWQYEATVYLFTAETETGVTTPTGTIEGTLSFKDALDNLDFAFMGAFGASNGQWSFLADYMMTDISFGNPTPGGAFSGINTAAKTQVLNAYAAYRVHQTPDLAVDLAAGLRWFDTRTTLTALPGILPGRTVVANDNWVDPVIGLRAQVRMSDKWSGIAFFDYGGFQSDSESWQALLTADYQLNDNWRLRFGYRYLSVDHTLSNGNDYSFTQSGPVFGATYRF
ncbi:porin family protein [Ruegeria sp. WL0004]|uniref:Porin family protein n=1 Tax=Ruegeria marisflavi TaxID=2984152 RepID=A0ABT2WLP8_9RHOB|nr:porin family protein [Ruegeria sp. WL0004]MCU9836824.1 porin family protein [Ruegeria sp. WL0004]